MAEALKVLESEILFVSLQQVCSPPHRGDQRAAARVQIHTHLAKGNTIFPGQSTLDKLIMLVVSAKYNRNKMSILIFGKIAQPSH